MEKLNTTSVSVPDLDTSALLPASTVVTVPIDIVGETPSLPFAPRGIEKSRTTSGLVSEAFTLTKVPGSPVVTSPTLILCIKSSACFPSTLSASPALDAYPLTRAS